MPNPLFNQKQQEIEKILRDIQKQIEEYTLINDVFQIKHFTQLKESIELWIVSDGSDAFPIDDDTLVKLGHVPLFFERMETSGEKQELSLTENIEPQSSKTQFNEAIADILEKISNAKDSYSLNTAQSFMESVAVKINNSGIFEEYQSKLNSLKNYFDEISTELAKSKYEQGKIAVEKKDYSSARSLYSEVLEIAPESSELLELAQIEIDQLPVDISRGDIELHLIQVEDSSDLKKRESSLKVLETYLKSNQLTVEDITRIKAAREKYNKEKSELGIGLSIIRLGDLREKYILKLEADSGLRGAENEEFNNDIIQMAYQQASNNAVNEELLIAKNQLAPQSPIAAKNKLTSLLNDKTTAKIGEKIEEIPAFPIDQNGINRIKDYLNEIASICEEERKAVEARNEAEMASDSFQKLVYYSQAKGFFNLPGLDVKINEILEPAVRVRIETFKNNLVELKHLAKNLALLSELEIKNAIATIEKEQASLISQMGYWPVDGKELVLPSGKKKLTFPQELKQFNEKLLVDIEKFRESFTPTKTAYERLCEITVGISEDLKDDDKRSKAISNFKNIVVNEEVKKSALFRELSAQVTRHADFDAVLQQIQSDRESKNWTSAFGNIVDLTSRPDYSNCPQATKHTVERIRNEIEPEYYLKQLDASIEKEDYSNALASIKWLKAKKIDSQRFTRNEEMIESIIITGKGIYEFYKQSLKSVNLSEDHYLISILFDRQSLINKALNKSINIEEIEKVKEICGSDFHYFSENKYTSLLQSHIQKINYLDLENFIRRLDYISGNFQKVDINWPEFQPSIVKMNASVLSSHIRNVIHSILLSDCKEPEKDKKALRNVIETAFNMKILFSENELREIKEVDYCLTQSELENGEFSADEIFEKWDLLRARWAGSQKIISAWKKSRVQKYLKDIKQLKEQAKYSEAYEEVERALNDKEIGAQDCFYLEKIKICLELNKISEARAIINEIESRFQNSRELVTLSTKEKIKRVLEVGNLTPAESIRQLIDLSNDGMLVASEIDKEIKRLFADFLNSVKKEIPEALKGSVEDKFQGLNKVILLSQAETEYKLYVSDYISIAPTFIMDFSPLLFEVGKKLHSENRECIDKAQNPDENDQLVKSINVARDLISKTRAYINLFRTFIPKINNKSLLIDLVKSLINLEENSTRKQNLQQLLETTSRNVSPPIRIIDLENDIIRLESILSNEITLAGKIKYLRNTDLWVQALIESFNGSFENPWKSIEAAISDLQDEPDFIEISRLRSGFANWKNNINNLVKISNGCRESYQSEDFQKVNEGLNQIRVLYDEIIPFDSGEISQIVKLKILELITVIDNNIANISGIVNVQKRVDQLLAELKTWQDFIDVQLASENRINNLIEDLKSKYKLFSDHLYPDETDSIKPYSIAISKLPKTTQGGIKVPLGGQQEKKHDQILYENEEMKKIILFGFQISRRKKKDPIIVTRLRRPRTFSDWTETVLNYQETIISEMTQECKIFFDRDNTRPFKNSQKAEKLSNDYQNICLRVDSIKNLTNEIQIAQLKFFKENPFPEKSDLEQLSAKKQFQKLAKNITNADLLGKKSDCDYIETYRDHAIDNILKQVR